MLFSKVVCPDGDRLMMSTDCGSGRVLPTWIGGLPTTVFPRTFVPRDPGARKMPLVLPMTVFSSRVFPEAVPITPIPKSSGGSA